MDRKQVHELLRRYVRGECDDDEQMKIHQWYDRLCKGDEVRLSDEEKMLLEDKLWKNIRTDLQAEALFPERKSRRRTFLSFYARVAAMLLIGAGFAWHFYRPEKVEEPVTVAAVNLPDRMQKVNKGDKPMKVKLMDGSQVTLLPGSSLDYPQRFHKEKREVMLTGDAFFEITPNPAQPFLVHNGKLVTQVLGTSFWIRTHQKSKSLEVEVVSGKVSVFESVAEEKSLHPDMEASRLGYNGVVLTPNQRVTYYPDKGYLLTSVVEEPVAIQVPAADEMSFDNEEVKDIVPVLFKKFGIEVLLAHEGLGHCTFTGDINGLPLYDALELICKSVGAGYEIKGTRILINGSGCD
ncbi:MAG: hypothetical protein ABS46_17620 [Cytophagaceae bacterium SCN 52-12]|nr:MAG: hypothetical protein ABS46_17620 [Cytophagaceae bacterium SCN 52-12]